MTAARREPSSGGDGSGGGVIGFPVAALLPSQLRRPVPPPPLPGGLDAAGHVLAGWLRRAPWRRRALRRRADAICAAMDGLRDLNDTGLRGRLQEARDALRRAAPGGRDSAVTDAAMACVGEAARRSLGLRPFAVQIMGGLTIQAGLLAEMATGEGKTLTAGLPAVLAAWTGRPCHLVTANDYLAARDAEIMAPLYRYCGVSVASVTAALKPEQRIAAYRADVVYITAKELLGDFLRDRLATRGGPDPARLMLQRWLAAPDAASDAASDAADADPSAGGGGVAVRQDPLLLVRGLDTAIVDEADSVLIDEAVTPLILSAQRDSRGIAVAARIAAAVAAALTPGTDYALAERQKAVSLKPGARTGMTAVAARLPPLWQAPARREELLRQALVARHFLRRDQHYVVQDGKVVLLDEFTGRLTPNRTLSAGLHQAIEAREGLEVTQPTEPLAQMTFQMFFRHFRRLSGMTGTGREAAGEFWRIYGLAVLPIPTNRPSRRRVAPPVVFMTQEAKWRAVVAQVERIHATGQPVLVGTRSVGASEHLAERLRAHGLTFALLNAVRHQEEARIVATAGQRGRITIATNMAGRGTDIKLGEGVAELGGLHVIATEINEAGRIDRQLLGRCARQGDPGSTSAFYSLEDELVRRFLGPAGRRLLARACGLHLPGAAALARRMFGMVQRTAERQASGRRQSVLQADTWLESALPSEGSG